MENGRGSLTGARRTAPEKERPAPVVAIFVFTGLAIVLPLTLLQSGTITGDSTNVFLAYLITCYSALAIARLCYSGAGQITRLAMFVFCYVFMGLAPLVQVADNAFPLQALGAGSYPAGAIRHALYVVLVGIAAFEVGTIAMRLFASGNERVRTQQRRTAGILRAPVWLNDWSVSRVKVIMLSLSGLVVISYFLSRTGIAPFFNSRQEAANAVLGEEDGGLAYAAANKVTRMLFRVLGQAPILLALFGILYMKRHNLWKDGRRHVELGAATILVLLVAANIIVNGPTGNSRYWFSTVAITLASIYVPLSKAKGLRWAAVVALVTLLFAFTTLQAFRREGGARDYSAGFRNDLVSSGTYSEFQMELIGDQWIADHGHTYGKQLLGNIMVFVPRSIWQGKPTDTGNLVLPLHNPAATLWTEGDVEAGFLGVVGYFVLLGAISRALDRRLRHARPGSIAHATIPIAGGFMILALRGSLQTAFGAAYGLAAVILFISRWSRRPVPQEPVASVSSGLSVR